MKYILSFLLNFVFVFILVYLIYVLLINRKKRKRGFSRLKGNDQIVIFVNRYNLDVEVIGYKKIINYISIINSIIISFASSIIINIDSIIWSILVSFVIVLVLIYSLFELMGRYLKNKEIKIKEEEKCITQKKSKKNGKNIG